MCNTYMRVFMCVYNNHTLRLRHQGWSPNEWPPHSLLVKCEGREAISWTFGLPGRSQDLEERLREGTTGKWWCYFNSLS